MHTSKRVPLSDFCISILYAQEKKEKKRNKPLQSLAISLYVSTFAASFGGLEIRYFVFQGSCNVMQPLGQLFTLSSWVLIQGCDDLKGTTEGQSLK